MAAEEGSRHCCSRDLPANSGFIGKPHRFSNDIIDWLGLSQCFRQPPCGDEPPGRTSRALACVDQGAISEDPKVLAAARQACACIRPLTPIGWCGSHMNVVRELRGGRWSERPRSIHLAADEVLGGPCVPTGGGLPMWRAASQLGDPPVFLDSHGLSASLAGRFALKG